MAKNVVIRDVEYASVPKVKIPLAAGGGEAEFLDTSDATLDSGAKMLNGNTAYAGGVKYEGTIQTKTASDLTASGATVTVPEGYYAAQATKAVDSGSATAAKNITGTGANVSAGNNTITLTKSVSNTPQVEEGYVASGTAGNSNVSLTANVTTKSAETIVPSTSPKTIAADTYLTGTQTIAGDPNLDGSNIVYGKSIFNVDGEVQVPVVSQDSTTKVLSIS